MTTANILIVEDESIVALDMQNRLRMLGYHVVGRATTGMEAIQQAETQQPDLILMDIRLQGPMDGIEAAAIIRKRKSIPVVYLTAYSDNETLKRAKLTEPHGYLIKPFEERELQTAIEVALYKHAMEQQVRVQAEQLSTILNTVPEGIVLLDSDHYVVTANPIGRAYLDELAALDADDRLVQLGEFKLSHFVQAPGVWQEIEIKTTNRRVFEIVAKPTMDNPDSKHCRWVLVIHDVTDLREIWQRSQQQAQLIVVGQLAAGIAHDFNNILSILSLGDQMILMTEPELKPQNKDRLENNLHQIERGSQLINQVLDFSRISTLESKIFDLLPLIKEITIMLERMLPENIQLELQALSPTCVLQADAARIQQVLMNLVINARDALPNGGHITITIRHLTIEPGQPTPLPDLYPGHWIRIQVTDDGVGIPEHILPHVFEPFYTTKPQGKGTGLGLAQVYGIVHQHNGALNITSNPEEGTAFDVYLPAFEAPQNEMDDTQMENEQLALGTSETIMIVEDEAMLRQNLGELLQLLDYQVVDAANGREALTVFDENREVIRLVLSDLVMPEMGGLDLCRQLRQRDEQVPIVIMSGYSSEVNAAELEELNVGAFLQKPMQPEALSQIIENLLYLNPA